VAGTPEARHHDDVGRFTVSFRQAVGEGKMPTYDFTCRECGKRFSLTMGIKERETKRPKCPKCGAGKPEPVFSTFFAKTSRKS
jgi:putative FmdB family regulatory protein